MRALCILVSLLALIIAFLACDKCSDTGDAAITPPIRFSIVNREGKNLVDTTQSYYSADSIRLFDLEEKEWIVLNKEFVSTVGGFVFAADFQKNISGKSSMILHLNSEDSDTLNVSYRQTDNKCFVVYEYTRFQYKGQDLQKSPRNTALLLIIKGN
jgi:hypothetical protein